MTKPNSSTAPPVLTTGFKYVKPDVSHLPLLDKDSFDTTLMRTLATACSYKRDYGTRTEASFVGWLANRLPVSLIDAAGNLHVDLRTAPNHRTCFTCHTDTVHVGGGANAVRVDGKFWRADGDPLGADDGAGVALLCHMIEAKVPGYYVFFRGEECGGIGSKWLASSMPAMFATIDRAIAFDRADYYDVITHQSGGRCCSDEFAEALASLLSTSQDWFIPCDTGVYTDTAELTGLVPECTNVSVGYKHQHGEREELDVEFLQRLADIVVSVDWDGLPTKRDPKAKDDERWNGYGLYGRSSSKHSGLHWKAQRDYESQYEAPWDDEHADIEDVGDVYGTARWDHNGAVHGTARYDYKGDDEYDGALECELFDALERAIHDEDYSSLLDMIAVYSYPEDPDWVRCKLSKQRLAKIICDCYDDLENGHPAEDVMDDLYAEARQ